MNEVVFFGPFLGHGVYLNKENDVIRFVKAVFGIRD